MTRPGGEADPAADGLPVVDVSALVERSGDPGAAARAIGAACRRDGFFYAVGHGVPPALQARLQELARRFFALDTEEKLRIRMALGGRAWRGYFPVGDELTSGRPDLKEGLYFGEELPPDDPRVRAGVPLHGPNLFPDEPSGLRETVLEYMGVLTELGHALMRGVSLSLGLDADHFRRRFMDDPLVLFRIFHYPPHETREGEEAESSWGVGEHTDYGVLTILKQDDVGGLQVKSRGRWIEAPPLPDAFVCNIGDTLERMTGGLYRSTPHRVRNVSGRSRYSFPSFFDPGFGARVEPVDVPGAEPGAAGEAGERWDGASVHDFEGTYGEYVLGKVAKVFPDLGERALGDAAVPDAGRPAPGAAPGAPLDARTVDRRGPGP